MTFSENVKKIYQLKVSDPLKVVASRKNKLQETIFNYTFRNCNIINDIVFKKTNYLS